MFRWCSYCWRFLGERPPLDDFSPTHGLCTACQTRGALSDMASVERCRPIAQLHAELISTAVTGDVPGAMALIDRGRQLGVVPTDLLIGTLQGALYEIGRLWEVRGISHQNEARFTTFVDAVLETLVMEQRVRIPNPTGPPIFIVNARNNAHTLGARMTAFVLRERGRDARAIVSALTVSWLARLCELLEPSIVGISIALPEQVAFASEVVDALARSSVRPRVVVGGYGARSLASLPAGLATWQSIDELIEP